MSTEDHHEHSGEPAKGPDDGALQHLREAEQDLEKAQLLEEKAEHEVEEALEELKAANKPVDITVNGRPKTVTEKKQSYRQIAKLAYPDADFAKYLYTITFFNGEHGREGDLVEGEKVHVVDGMVFNVRRSDKS